MVADEGGAESVAADLPAERAVAGLAGHGGLEGSGGPVCAADFAGEPAAMKLQAPARAALSGDVGEPARLPHLDLPPEALGAWIKSVGACGVGDRLQTRPEGERTQHRGGQRGNHDRVADRQPHAGDAGTGVR
jgi:hypothetical protein